MQKLRVIGLFLVLFIVSIQPGFVHAQSASTTQVGTIRFRAAVNGVQVATTSPIAIDVISPDGSLTKNFQTNVLADYVHNNPVGTYTVALSAGNTLGTGITFLDITPSKTQVLAAEGDITFFFNFVQATTTSTNFASSSQAFGSIYCPSLTTNLTRGSTGSQVKELQKFMAGYFSLDEEEFVTGFFGRLTQGYVKRFQENRGINPTGFVGSVTRDAIQEVCRSFYAYDASRASAASSDAKSAEATGGIDSKTGITGGIDSSFRNNAKSNNLLIDIPSTVKAGWTIPVGVTMENTGNTTWTSSEGYKLGSQNPQDNTIWGFNRVNLGDNTVAPGKTHTFNFSVTAPTAPGTYNFQFKMLKEGVEWFGTSTENRSITVESADSQKPSCTLTVVSEPINGVNINSGVLKWATANATSFSVSPNLGTVNLSGSTLVFPKTTTTYTGTVVGRDGSSATCSGTVIVADSQTATTTSSQTYTHYTIGPWTACTYYSGSGGYQLRTVTPEVNSTPLLPTEPTFAPSKIQTCTVGNGTLKIRATLNGNQISAGSIAIDYTSPVQSGTEYTVQVGDNLTRPAGNYTVNYSSGNTAGTGIVFSSITPGSNQTLSSGGEITYTFNFSCASGYSYSNGSCVAVAAQSATATTTITATTQATTPIPGTCAAIYKTCSNGTTVGIDSREDKTTYYWQCNGLNGGGNTSCSAHKPNGNLMFQAKVNGVPLTAPWKSAVDITLNGVPRGTYQVDGSGTTFTNGVYNYQNNEIGNYSIEYSAGNTLGAGYAFKGITTPEDSQISGSKSGNLSDGGTLMFILNFTGPTSMIDGGRSLANVITAVQGSSDASVGKLVNTVSSESSGLAYVWGRDLQVGAPYAEDISALQKALMREGVYSGEITGGFYSQTFIAVRDFQEKYGIKATGYVGYITRQKLNSLYSK